MRTLALLSLAAVVAATAATARADTHPVPIDEIVVTRDTAAVPRGCAPREFASLLLEFADAFNRGDARALDALFAPMRSGTVGVPEDDGSMAFQFFEGVYDRKELLPLLLAKHAQGVRLRIAAVAVASGRRGTTTAALVTVARTRGRAVAFAEAKVVVNCDRKTIFQGGIGFDAPPAAATSLCGTPLPPGIVVACAYGMTAFARAESFRVGDTRARLRPRCAVGAATERVQALFFAFNLGRAADFARQFGAGSSARFYTGAASRRRPAIAAFVRSRYAAGDGWTATALAPPMRARAVAAYRVGFDVFHQGRLVGKGSAKMVVDCRSGLIRAWVGPALPPPS